MKRIRVTKNNMLLCPRISTHIDYTENCLSCDDLFGSEQGMGNRYVSCKRGKDGKDDWVKKSENRR